VAVVHEVGDALAAQLAREEGGRPRAAGVTEREHRRLQATGQRRDHDEVEVERLGVPPHAVAPDGVLERRALILALGRKARVPVRHARVLREQYVLLGREGRLALRHVVRTLGVPDEEDPLAALLEEEAEAALLVVPKTVRVLVREEVRCAASQARPGVSEVHRHLGRVVGLHGKVFTARVEQGQNSGQD